MTALVLAAGCESLDPMAERTVGVQPFPLTQICPRGETIEGIDVSYWQSTIDWDTVASGDVNFVIMRASVNLHEDSNFDFNWAGARRVGIIRGAYHYFHPDVDAAAQAEVFLAAMGPLEADDLPPTLDVEEDEGAPPPDQYAAAVRTWLDMVEAATGRVPMIYCGAYFWESYVQATDMVDHPLWPAHWDVTCPNVPTPWTDWAFHQYDVTNAGTVPGITTAIDRDVFNGTMDDLMDFLSVTPVCGDGRCNGGETYETCPDDCPRCEPIPPEGRVVDESETCFEKGGPPEYWRTEAAGWNDSLFWTHTTDDADVANFARWSFDFEEAGMYLLEAYTPAPWAESRQAGYTVVHGGDTDTVVVDQTAADGWNEIGEFAFAAGPDQSLYLPDNTGEPVSGETQLVADAVRLTRVDGPVDEDAEEAEEPVVEPVPEVTPDTSEDALSDTVEPDSGVGTMSIEGGCGCSLTG
jgi:lysozyme